MHQGGDPVLYGEELRHADAGVALEVPGRVRLVVVPVQRGQRRGGVGGTTEQPADEVVVPDDLGVLLRPDPGTPPEQPIQRAVRRTAPSHHLRNGHLAPQLVDRAHRLDHHRRSDRRRQPSRKEARQPLGPLRAERHRPQLRRQPGHRIGADPARHRLHLVHQRGETESSKPPRRELDARVTRRTHLPEHVRPSHHPEHRGRIRPLDLRHRIVPRPRLAERHRQARPSVRNQNLLPQLRQRRGLDQPHMVDHVPQPLGRREALVAHA